MVIKNSGLFCHHTYKIRYWLAGNIKVIEIKAKDLTEALAYFYMTYPCDGVIDVVEQSA
jgi:hypothetical protein